MRIKMALMSGPDLATDEGLEAFLDALGVPDDEPDEGAKHSGAPDQRSSHGGREHDGGALGHSAGLFRYVEPTASACNCH